MEATNVQKDVKPHIVLIDGVKYYCDKPDDLPQLAFLENRKFSTFLGRKTATISLKSFSLNSRRSARAAVTHPAAPA